MEPILPDPSGLVIPGSPPTTDDPNRRRQHLATLPRVFIASFPAGPWQTNCYVVATQPGAECLIIDPGVGAAQGVRDLVAETLDVSPAQVSLSGAADPITSAVIVTGYAATPESAQALAQAGAEATAAEMVENIQPPKLPAEPGPRLGMTGERPG